MKKDLGILVIVLGFVAGILFFIAGAILWNHGVSLTTLRSVGGGTVNEAYYQEIGQYGIAFSLFAYAMGIGTILVSLGLGGLLFAKGEIAPVIPS